jgi:hypothetical protein
MPLLFIEFIYPPILWLEHLILPMDSSIILTSNVIDQDQPITADKWGLGSVL